jgi:hypothetical protein
VSTPPATTPCHCSIMSRPFVFVVAHRESSPGRGRGFVMLHW